MSTLNNWFDHNIDKRLADPLSPFTITIKPQAITIPDMQTASAEVVKLLAEKNKKIFVGLSGGMDSEYTMKRFLEEGVDATPIIVSAPSNALESMFAFKFCKENNLNPVVIEKTDVEVVTIFYEEILKKVNGTGFESTHALIAAQYAKDNDGIFVKSDHLLGDDQDWRKPITFIGSNEWDFYNDALLGRENSFCFFMYTPQLIGRLVKSIPNDLNAQEYKQKMFDVPLRPKIRNQYHPAVRSLFFHMMTGRVFSNKSYNFKSFEEFLSIIEG